MHACICRNLFGRSAGVPIQLSPQCGLAVTLCAGVPWACTCQVGWLVSPFIHVDQGAAAAHTLGSTAETTPAQTQPDFVLLAPC